MPLESQHVQFTDGASSVKNLFELMITYIDMMQKK